MLRHASQIARASHICLSPMVTVIYGYSLLLSTLGYLLSSSTMKTYEKVCSTSLPRTSKRRFLHIFTFNEQRLYVLRQTSTHSTALRRPFNSEWTGKSISRRVCTRLYGQILDRIFQNFQSSHLLEGGEKWAYYNGKTSLGKDQLCWTPSRWTTRYVCALQHNYKKNVLGNLQEKSVISLHHGLAFVFGFDNARKLQVQASLHPIAK